MIKGQAETVERIAAAVQEMMRARSTNRPEPWLHLDLTLPQLKALFLLGATGPARPSAIAEAIGVTATGATGLLDRLEERSLVRRRPDPADRRAIVVELEPAARALLDDIYASGREQLVEVLQRMQHDDLEALERGMTALVAAQAALAAERAPAPAAHQDVVTARG